MKTRKRMMMGAALVGAMGAGAQADELIVPSASYPSLAIAIAAAADNDTVTLLPSGSPYLAVPGYVISNKTITLRGSTGDPNDVVIDGFDVVQNVVLEFNGVATSGSVIQDLTITGGSSPLINNYGGAGLRLVEAGSVTIDNCIICDNVNPATDGDGAGIYSVATSITCIDTVFENNTLMVGNADAGAAMLLNGDHVFVNCRFLNNGIDASVTPANGATAGGVYAGAGSAQFIRCSFEGNRGFSGGALGSSGNASIIVDACEFVANEGQRGCGYYNSSSGSGAVPIIRNSLFDGNHATVNDAAIFTNKGAQIRSCTFVNNVADSSYIIGGSPAPGSVVIDNSIVWGNTMNTNIIPAPMAAVVRNNIFQQAYGGGGGSKDNQVADPGFVNFAGGDYHLAAGSPAIDSGDSNLYMGPFSDLDGNLRVLDDPDTVDTGFSIDGPVIDAGCFEFQPDGAVVDTCPVDANGDNVIDLADLQLLLFEFGSTCP